MVRLSLAFVVCLASLASASHVIAQNLDSFTMGMPRGEFPLTDFDNRSVELDEIMSGGPPKDGIPSIDAPEFDTTEAAADWLPANEPVIALVIGDDARAYPLQILIYHEIVNDVVDDKPVAVTFCPLCNASIVFDATIDGQTLDFGTTGRLRKSDLVMYDRQTETWWQQFTGTGIVGTFNEVQLQQIPSQIVSFDVFRTTYPDGKVLNRNTGTSRPYGNNPYRGYDDINSTPFLFRDPIDPRLPPMERVLALADENSDAKFQLVPLSTLEKHPILSVDDVVVLATSTANSALDDSNIRDSRLIPAAAAFETQLNGKPVSLELNDNQQLIDVETQSVWSPLGIAVAGPLKGQQLKQVDRGVHFAFAWLAFDPTATIIKEP